jgi:signal transduction histidine kinase
MAGLPVELDARGRLLVRLGLGWSTLVCVVWAVAVDGTRADWVDLGTAGTALSVLAALALPWGMRFPATVAAVAVVDVAVNQLSPTIAVAATLLAARVRVRPLLAAAVLNGVVLVVLLVAVPDRYVDVLFREGTTVALPTTLGLLLRTTGDRARAERARVAELELRRDADRREAVLAERLRLERELHDGLGHRVSLMVLALSGVDAQLDRDPALARELVHHVQGVGHEAMQELRAVVLDEQRPPDDWPVAVQDAVARVRAAGLPVDLHLDPPAGPLLDGRGTLVARVVAEGLNNVAVHAPGATTTVTVGPAGGVLTAAVENARPTRPPSVAVTAGTGLDRLRRDATAAGGELTAGPTAAGGYLLTLRLPVAAAHDEEAP